MRSTLRMRAGAATLALTGAVLLSGCDPTLVPQLIVNTTADGVDAAPGDGVCETAPGNGVCSLRAAVGEGNALGRADLTVPAGTYTLTVSDPADGDVDLDVIGRLSVNWAAPAAVEVTPRVEVAAGGSLNFDGVKVSGRITVAGSLVANRSVLALPPGSAPAPTAPVRIAPTGRAIISNSDVFGWTHQGVIHNEGGLELLYSTITGVPFASTPILTTTAGALSGLTATRFTAVASFRGMIIPDYPGMPACSGPVVSRGHNTTLNDSCGLDQPGDTENGGLNAWVDRIPVGVHSCGVQTVGDRVGNPRPTDGNGDGTAACDTGSTEVAAAP